MTFANKATEFYSGLTVPGSLPDGVSVMNPYESHDVKEIIESFYKKFFSDNNKRIFIWGINPGRFGGGLTGIGFTDPVVLREYCGIENNLGDKRELSSRFIYEMIDAFGGVNKFYSECYFTAMYPLALIKNDKNYNYYDEPELYAALKDEIIESFKVQVSFGADKSLALCLGKKNYLYLEEINDELKYFDRIEIVEHPRYIMQYKSKAKDFYIKKYIDLLT